MRTGTIAKSRSTENDKNENTDTHDDDGNDADDDSSVIDGATPKAKRSKTAAPQRDAYQLRAKPCDSCVRSYSHSTRRWID